MTKKIVTKRGLKKSSHPRSTVAKRRNKIEYPVQPVPRLNMAPAAVSVGWNRKMGLPDMKMRLSWQMGTVFVGNGTLGASGSVYFRNLAGSIYVSGVPVALNDSATYLVPSYLQDVVKHFARCAVQKLRIRAVPIVSSTSNSATLFIAPIRGGQFFSVAPVNDTTASLTVAQMMTMKGVVGGAVYEEFGLDLTPYLAGGSGAKQNEVAVANEEFTSSTTVGADAQTLCGITIGGNVITTSLNGYNTHYLLVDAELSLLDFIGGVVDPTGFGDQPRVVAYTAKGLHAVDEKGVLNPILRQPKRVSYARSMSGTFPSAQGTNVCSMTGPWPSSFTLSLKPDNSFLSGEVCLIDASGSNTTIALTNTVWSPTGVMTLQTGLGSVTIYLDVNSWSFVGSGTLMGATISIEGRWDPNSKSVTATYWWAYASDRCKTAATLSGPGKQDPPGESKSNLVAPALTPQRTGWFVV